MVFITERFFEVVKESWPEWDLNPQPLNSFQNSVIYMYICIYIYICALLLNIYFIKYVLLLKVFGILCPF